MTPVPSLTCADCAHAGTRRTRTMGPARKKEEPPMGALKRWRALGGSGGGSGEQFYKFHTIGQVLEGIWRGTQRGKYGDNGVVETEDGVRQVFTLSAMLKDLVDVDDGTEVQITYLGM